MYLGLDYGFLPEAEYFEILLELELIGLGQEEFDFAEELLESNCYFLKNILDEWIDGDPASKAIVLNRLRTVFKNAPSKPH